MKNPVEAMSKSLASDKSKKEKKIINTRWSKKRRLQVQKTD